MKICLYEGCDKSVHAKGFCSNHYVQQLRKDPNRPRCLVDGCEEATYGNGLCFNCWSRNRRNGTPDYQKAKNGELLEFLEKLIVEEMDEECRDWPFGGSPNGYGAINVNGKKTTASRAMLILMTGEDNEEKFACHSCDRPSCVAPWHLSWGSPSDNFYQMLSRGPERLKVFGKEEFIGGGYCPHCDHCNEGGS